MMADDLVAHYPMNIGSSTLMLRDVIPGMSESPLSGSAYVYVPDVDVACKKAAEAGASCPPVVSNF
jgi:uncharacterized glyoxalase superfamily protein PhnB